MNLEEKERIEIEFWKDSKLENPEQFTRQNFLNKTHQLQTFNKKIQKRLKYIKNKKNVLELGAGQGWASAYLKRWVIKDAKFTVTDISPYAVQSVKYWEELYDIKIDDSLACKSYELPFQDEQFDLVFCYAAAHHFVKLEETLAEVRRVLKPGAACIFFYEPTCSKLFYKLHLKYVYSLDPGTPEDILIPKEIKKLADKLNLDCIHHYDVESQAIRSLVLGLYFKILSVFGFLKKLLPSSSDFIFIKNA